MTFTNRTAWLIVFAFWSVIALAGCESHWHTCTKPGQVFRHEDRKLGLCAADLDRFPYSYRLIQD